MEGSIDDADHMLCSLVRSDGTLAALSAAYTLASVKPFPAAVEDGYAIVSWARANKAKLAWNGKWLVVAGIDAGANLAAVVPHMSRDRGGPKIAGQVLIMPMLDAGLTTCSMRERPLCRTSTTLMDQLAGSCAAGYRTYLPHAVDRTHPYASPLQSSRLKGLPSALILTAENDPLRDDGKQYAEKLDRCGVATTLACLPTSCLEHGGRNDSACTFALDHIGAFLKVVRSAA